MRNLSARIGAGIAALVVVGLGVQQLVQAQTGGGITTIVCKGTKCGGGGTRQYQYTVRPKSAVETVEIGTHNPNIGEYTNILAPAGWSLVSIDAVQRAHDAIPTSHGIVTGNSGNCDFIMKWQGPPTSTNFTLGFDMEWDFHDVNWKTISSTETRQTGWSFPLGTGTGPVHGPLMR